MNLRKKKNRRKAELNAQALNDIMFFLLLFFLIASTLTNPNVIKLLLPKSDSGKTITKKNISLHLDNNLNLYLENVLIDFDELPYELESLADENNQQVTVMLFADKSTPLEYIVKILDTGQQLNLKTVLATKKYSE